MRFLLFCPKAAQSKFLTNCILFFTSNKLIKPGLLLISYTGSGKEILGMVQGKESKINTHINMQLKPTNIQSPSSHMLISGKTRATQAALHHQIQLKGCINTCEQLKDV